MGAGLDYIYSRGVIHCDFSCRNVFLTAQRQIKIGDFGGAKLDDNLPLDAEEPFGTNCHSVVDLGMNDRISRENCLLLDAPSTRSWPGENLMANSLIPRWRSVMNKNSFRTSVTLRVALSFKSAGERSTRALVMYYRI